MVNSTGAIYIMMNYNILMSLVLVCGCHGSIMNDNKELIKGARVSDVINIVVTVFN